MDAITTLRAIVNAGYVTTLKQKDGLLHLSAVSGEHRHETYVDDDGMLQTLPPSRSC